MAVATRTIRRNAPGRLGRGDAALLAALAMAAAFFLAAPARGETMSPDPHAAGNSVAFLSVQAPRQFYQEDGATYDSDGEYLGEHAPGDAVYGEDGDYLGTVEPDSRGSSDGGSDAGRESPSIWELLPRHRYLFGSESDD